jgi:addiction module HigA family antidote
MQLFGPYNPQSRPHPGETLEEKLEEMQVSPEAFAASVGVAESVIIGLLAGSCNVSPAIAAKLEQGTKIPVSFWLRHQQSYDEYMAKQKAATEAAADG